MTSQEFVKKISEGNKELAEKLQACKSQEEAYAVAQSAGVTDEFNDFVAEMTKVYDSSKDLSDEDMENVAGGKWEKEDTYFVVSLAVSVTGAAASAAS